MTSSQKVFVFDVNGTLLIRVKEKKGEHLKKRDADGVLPGMGDLLYIRPHLEKLIEFLHGNNIRYCLWTTAMEHNAVHLVQLLKDRGLNRAAHTYYYSHSTPEVGHPYKRGKELSKIAEVEKTDLENVFLIDDEVRKCIPQSQHIEISEYNALNDEDDAFLQIIEVIKTHIK